MQHDELARAVGRVEEKLDRVLDGQTSFASRMDAIDGRVASLEQCRDRVKTLHRAAAWLVGVAITVGGAAMALWDVAKGKPQP